VTPFTDDEKALRQGLEGLAPTDAGGDLESAIRLAEDCSPPAGRTAVVVLTDHAPKEDGPKRPEPVTWVACGRASDNVALTRFATRPLLNSPETSEVLVEIANFGRKPRRETWKSPSITSCSM